MWGETFLLLLLHTVEAAVASQCWQGATFSEAVVSPAVESSGILRVPGAASLPQCVAACCDLPGYDLAWLFEGRCYVLSCQQRENCQPRERPGADSVLAFLRRSSPQTLVLQSLVRGEPYGGGRWRSPSRSSEAPGDLEALKDLALFDGGRQDFSDPGVLDVEYSEGSQEERGGPAAEDDLTSDPPPSKGGSFNQSEAEGGPEGGAAESGVAQNRASSGGAVRLGDEGGARGEEEEATSRRSTDATSLMQLLRQKPTAGSAHRDHTRTPLPTAAEPQRPISTNTQTAAGRPLTASLGNPVEERTAPTEAVHGPVPPEHTTVTGGSFQSAAPPTATQTLATAVTSDPSASVSTSTATSTSTSTPDASPPAVTTPSATTTESGSEVGGSNRGPVAAVGPDRKLFLPASSVVLDGSGSSDDHGIVSYRWDAVSGPPGSQLEAADQAVATATGLRAGRYTFRLTVSDQQGATDSSSLTVRVEASTPPPVAHASGSHSLTLPNNSLVLRGSVTDGDQTEIHFLWIRDSQSPAAGDVLYGSAAQACLFLTNLVEGTYLFQLQVTDAQGRCSAATATVEVRPEPGGGEEVELEMQVSVSQVSVAQRDTVVRQLAALLHVLDRDVQVRALQGHSHLSTVLRLSVRGPSGSLISGSRLAALLRNQLLREKSDYLLFRVLRVDTVLCLLRCSGQGQCDPITKQCACDPFWTENLIRRYLGDGESNCEWRVLYVILTSFMLVVLILSVSWTFICCCKRRRQTKVRKKTKYTILDNMDEQERVELRPKFSIKHRSTEHNSSLMMSESELDSDQDTIFSRDRPVRSRNRLSAQAARNGNAFG